jgi:two-component system response regulator FlrC
MAPPSRYSILVVDDEPGLAQTLRRVLEFGGHTVTTSETGTEALKRLAEQPFAVVITDIFLPDIDGPQIIAATRKLQATARIVAISGGGAYMSSPDALNVARKLGADGVLMKPFTPAQLLDVVKEVTADRS